MRNCPRCGRENGADVRFCGRCGLDLHEYDASRARPAGALEGTGDAFCYRHPKVATGLSCGRCERPVCTRCAIMGPAGIRCRECAKHTVAIRPGAVVYGAKRSFGSILGAGRGGIWPLYLLLALGSTVFGAVRSCARPPQRGEAPPVSAPEPRR